MRRADDIRSYLFSSIVVALLATGCGEKPSAGPPAAKGRDALAKQLAGLSPEKRAEYVRQHPEALGVLSGTPQPDPQP